MLNIGNKIILLRKEKGWSQGEYSSYDKDTADRLKDIQKIDNNTKSVLFNVNDTYIQNFQTKQTFATK